MHWNYSEGGEAKVTEGFFKHDLKDWDLFGRVTVSAFLKLEIAQFLYFHFLTPFWLTKTARSLWFSSISLFWELQRHFLKIFNILINYFSITSVFPLDVKCYHFKSADQASLSFEGDENCIYDFILSHDVFSLFFRQK